jgi:glycine betaine/proline transport system substrate-binding protein
VPLWKPQFLHYKHTIRELKEPQGLLGVVDRAVLLLREDKQALFNQAQLNTLDKLRFSNEIIAELDYKVCKNLQPLDDVTRNWLNNNPIKK